MVHMGMVYVKHCIYKYIGKTIYIYLIIISNSYLTLIVRIIMNIPIYNWFKKKIHNKPFII
jgi:hypothetical protein